MQAIVNVERKRAHVQDVYLGYRICFVDGCCLATPCGWYGEVLAAESLPAVRREIWRWWHPVQGQPAPASKAAR